MNVPRRVSQTELGLYKTEKERESGCGARIKRVWSWISDKQSWRVAR